MKWFVLLVGLMLVGSVSALFNNDDLILIRSVTSTNSTVTINNSYYYNTTINTTIYINTTINNTINTTINQTNYFNATGMPPYLYGQNNIYYNDTFGNASTLLLCQVYNDTSMIQWINTTLNNSKINIEDAEALLLTSFFNASSIEVTTGTPQGTIDLIRVYDSLPYNVSESASDLLFYVNFTGVDTFNQLIVRYRTGVGEPHTVSVSLWDYDSASWEGYGALGGTNNNYAMYTIGVFDPTEHKDGGIVQVRFITTNAGGNTDMWNFDWVALSKGASLSAITETDPIAVPLFYDLNSTVQFIKNNLTLLDGSDKQLFIGRNNSRLGLSYVNDVYIVGKNNYAGGSNETLLGFGCQGSNTYPVQLCNGNNHVYIPKLSSPTIEGGSWEGSFFVADYGYGNIFMESPLYYVKDLSLNSYSLATSDGSYIYLGESSQRNWMYNNLYFSPGYGVNWSFVLSPPAFALLSTVQSVNSSLNDSKLNANDQRYNDTALIKSPQKYINIALNNGARVWTNQPLADTEMINAPRTILETYNFTQYRFSVYTASPGNQTARLYLAYRTTLNTGAFINLTPFVPINATGIYTTGWNSSLGGFVNQSTVEIIIYGVGGNGVNDPGINNIQLELK
jgi:hypothetical protein